MSRWKRKENLKCIVCKEIKPRDNFRLYSNSREKGWDKRSNKCKQCEQNRVSNYRKNTLRGKFYTYKKNAKERGIDFGLTFEEFSYFHQKKCFFCGCNIDNVGLDRMDNNKGYFIDNVVPCCITCNRMKSTSTFDDFKKHIKKISVKLKLFS
jgi:hypothetical protein